MFGFLTQQARDHPDPLLTPKTASGWLRQLPTLDVIGRQQHVMRAFDGMRQARKGADPNRVAAVEFLDSALGADRRQLIKQYVDTDAKLRVFRYERWIPAKWMELHKLYMRSTELGVERVLVALGSGGANATH